MSRHNCYAATGLWLFLTCSSAISQSLPQTAAYIISGGFVDRNDLKESSASLADSPLKNEKNLPSNLKLEQKSNWVYIPGHMVLPTFGMPPALLIEVNRQDCEFLLHNREGKIATFYFNRVIVEDISHKTVFAGMFSMVHLYLVGEDHVVCYGLDKSKQCSRQL